MFGQKMEPGSSETCEVGGQERTETETRDSDQIQEEMFFPRGQPNGRAGCPQNLRSLHPWRFFTSIWLKTYTIWSDLTDDNALSRKLAQTIPEVLSNPAFPINLWIEVFELLSLKICFHDNRRLQLSYVASKIVGLIPISQSRMGKKQRRKTKPLLT